MIDMAAVALARRDLVIMAKPYGVMCRNCDDSVELFQCESIQDVRTMVKNGELDEHTCIQNAKG